jgi:hypothetical protein
MVDNDAESRISSSFLSDLDSVCPKEHDGNLPLYFLEDLEAAHSHALVQAPERSVVSDATIATLANEFKAWRSHHQRLLHHYLEMLPEDDPIRSPVSLFGTMDYGRLETAHTRALAWLFGDREHGFHNQLLEGIMRHLRGDRCIGTISVESVKSEHPVSRGPTSAGRIDIFAEGRWEEDGKNVKWVLVIEAKIDAHEGEEQLARYDMWLDHDYAHSTQIRAFLTPEGRPPETNSSKRHWDTLSFVDLAKVFRSVQGLQTKPGYHYLRYYLTGVLRDVCGVWVQASRDCENPYAAVDYLSYLRFDPALDDSEGECGKLR